MKNRYSRERFMKISPLIAALMVMVGLLSIAVVLLTARHMWLLRVNRGLQPVVAQSQASQAFANALAMDAVEYSKRNPAIDPLLQAFGLKQGAPAPATAPKPGSK